MNTAVENEKRPPLSINTNVNRKSWKSFFNSPTTSSSSLKLSPSSNSSQSTLNEHRHKRTVSLDTASSVSSLFKKKLHLSTPSQPLLENFEPIAPEHIMPSIVDWSPEMPISPPPWEMDEPPSLLLRNNSNDSNKSSSSKSSEAVTPVDTYHLKRRSSCPDIKALSIASSSSSSSSSLSPTLVDDDNDVISITQAHTQHISLLRRAPLDKKPKWKKCEKIKAKAAEAAAQGEIFQPNSIFSTFCDDRLKYLYIPNVFDPFTREPVLKFASIRPRKYQLHRKTSWKKEAKALMKWHHTLEKNLRQPFPIPCMPHDLPQDKLKENWLTRRFILREFFTTEVNFWNQLLYTKVIFYDALEHALLVNQSKYIKPENADVFANLFDLMQFSAKLINLLRRFHFNCVDKSLMPPSDEDGPCANIECNNLFIGQKIIDMSEDLVVFLRCAIDYKGNRKILDTIENNACVSQYRQQLSSKKETSYFTIKDYLIIPIQRVARYVLLITDLIKHTPADHPDYPNLVKSYQIITSLATAMDLVQKKPKKN